MVAEDAASFDEFGGAVAIDGDTVVVGAQEDDDLGGSSGSAYVFERDAGGAGAWGPVARLTGSDGNFGVAVAIDAGIIAIGSSFADFYPAGGAVDVFTNAGSDSWKHVANLRPAAGGCIEDTTVCGWSADARFGASVSLDADTVYVGQSAIAGAHSYVFQRLDPGSWARVAWPLPTSDFSSGDQFALAVAVSGETLLAGAPGHDETAGQAGTVFVFERDQGGPERWTLDDGPQDPDRQDIDHDDDFETTERTVVCEIGAEPLAPGFDEIGLSGLWRTRRSTLLPDRACWKRPPGSPLQLQSASRPSPSRLPRVRLVRRRRPRRPRSPRRGRREPRAPTAA